MLMSQLQVLNLNIHRYGSENSLAKMVVKMTLFETL